MNFRTDIKAIIFDYGGTIDTNARHWSEVLWEACRQCGVPVSKDEFRTSYVAAERALSKERLILPHHTFHDLLSIKCALETRDLAGRGVWDASPTLQTETAAEMAKWCDQYVRNVLQTNRQVLRSLAQRHILAVVSNFYGNLHTVLADYQLDCFRHVIDSTEVGVRKPDPQIFRIAIQALALPPANILVVGDSFENDILPAASLGCHTAWVKGTGWTDKAHDESLPTFIVSNIAQMETTLSLRCDNLRLVL